MCQHRPPPLPTCVTGWYRDTLADLVVSAKWGHDPVLTELLGGWVAAAAQHEGWAGRFDGWLAIPRDRWRLLRHGVPLSQRVGAVAATALQLPALPPPRRRWRPPQGGLSGALRRHNLDGALHYPKRHAAKVRSRRVLIIDDVWTTGSTIRECARALHAAGAAATGALVIAARS
ncbi:MAG: phosphoribosyltransferase family protein [Planctomycetota bacterium]